MYKYLPFLKPNVLPKLCLTKLAAQWWFSTSGQDQKKLLPKEIQPLFRSPLFFSLKWSLTCCQGDAPTVGSTLPKPILAFGLCLKEDAAPLQFTHFFLLPSSLFQQVTILFSCSALVTAEKPLTSSLSFFHFSKAENPILFFSHLSSRLSGLGQQLSISSLSLGQVQQKKDHLRHFVSLPVPKQWKYRRNKTQFSRSSSCCPSFISNSL